MPGPLPHTRLLAEAEAWPLISGEAFRACWLSLSTRPLKTEAQTRVENELTEHLRAQARGGSIETMRLLLEAAWQDDRDSPNRSIADYLIALARRHLELRGAEVVLRQNDGLPRAVEHWRWLSLFLPPDLLIAALFAANDRVALCEQVSLSPRFLAELLAEQPSAETHLHLGAATTFSSLWTALMTGLAFRPCTPKLEDAPFGDARTFAGYLSIAALTRWFLAHFIRWREAASHARTWSIFEGNLAEARRTARGAFAWLRGGRRELQIPRIRHLYRRLLPRPRHSETWKALEAADPLSAWFSPSDVCSAETSFARCAIRYLASEGGSDREFAELFWQYERVRCKTYQFLVQQPGTAGLDWFTKHYGRISCIQKTARIPEDRKIELALAGEARGLRLGSLELRTAPAPSAERNRRFLRDVARGAERSRRGGRQSEIGVTFHFIKNTTNRLGRGVTEPGQPYFGTRCGAWFHARRREALALERMLETNPELLLLFRGIDVASVELAVPTWAILPLFARVRAASEKACAALARIRPEWRPAPIRATPHAGEEYRRLAEGLRRIHELIEFGAIHPGDRIGHGLALGHDPSRWSVELGVCVQPAEDRLDDLLWELDRYGRGDFAPPHSRTEVVRAEIRRLALAIYGGQERATAEDLLDARRRRHDPAVLERLGFPFGCRVERARDPIERLIVAYLTDTDVYRRGRAIEVVRSTPAEQEMLVEAQQWLCASLSALDITIEGNPSSNLRIGDFGDAETLPIFRIHPLEHGRRRAPLSISADDPITFATCLADELAYLSFSCIRASSDQAALTDWLSRLRTQGWRSRFTLPASADPASLTDLLPQPLTSKQQSGTLSSHEE
jgi:hypothetical protein